MSSFCVPIGLEDWPTFGINYLEKFYVTHKSVMFNYISVYNAMASYTFGNQKCENFESNNMDFENLSFC